MVYYKKTGLILISLSTYIALCSNLNIKTVQCVESVLIDQNDLIIESNVRYKKQKLINQTHLDFAKKLVDNLQKQVSSISLAAFKFPINNQKNLKSAQPNQNFISSLSNFQKIVYANFDNNYLIKTENIQEKINFIESVLTFFNSLISDKLDEIKQILNNLLFFNKDLTYNFFLLLHKSVILLNLAKIVNNIFESSFNNYKQKTHKIDFNFFERKKEQLNKYIDYISNYNKENFIYIAKQVLLKSSKSHNIDDMNSLLVTLYCTYTKQKFPPYKLYEDILKILCKKNNFKSMKKEVLDTLQEFELTISNFCKKISHKLNTIGIDLED